MQIHVRTPDPMGAPRALLARSQWAPGAFLRSPAAVAQCASKLRSPTPGRSQRAGHGRESHCVPAGDALEGTIGAARCALAYPRVPRSPKPMQVQRSMFT